MTRRHSYFLKVLTLVLLVLALLSGCKRSESHPLRVGMDLSYPPFEMQDKHGNPDGVSVKLAEALAKKLGRPLTLVPMEFSGLIPALKTNNVDLVISSVTATEERRASISFSAPYAITGLALLVHKNSALQSHEDLKKPSRPALDGKTRAYRIAVKSATTGETWAIKNLPDVARVTFEDASACVLEVAQGRADAFLFDQLSVYKYAKQNSETTRALLTAFTEEPWAIGVAKDNPKLLGEVNTFLEEFRSQGGLTSLGDRYLKEEKAQLESAGIPFLLR
jgi:polar amino acid transport system substrate-binding protein